MKYIFFGTPRFAAIILDALIEAGIPPAAVVCNPDRPVGRKQIITPPPVKVTTVEHSAEIDIIQPESFDHTFLHRLRELEPDFFVVAAYARIIPKDVLAIPRLGTVGTHPSLLPKYRGASPIQSALLAGEAESGTTLYHMDNKVDHGPILAQRTLAVAPDDDYLSLEEKLAQLSGKLLAETLPAFAEGKITPRAQDESAATFTKKFTTAEGFIPQSDLDKASKDDPELARAIHNKIRALNPEPGCWTLRAEDQKRIKLLEARINTDGLLVIEKIQEEGQKPKVISL